MTWSSRTTVRGRVDAGVQPTRGTGDRWLLEELAQPEGDALAADLEIPRSEPDPISYARHRAERLQAEQSERDAREAELRERVAAEAYARGRTDGAAEGEARTRAELAEVLRTAGDAVAQLRAQETRLLHHLEENLAALAVGVARHVIGREVKGDPTLVAELVRRALTEFPIEQPVRIRVHPLDLSALTTAATLDGAPIEVAPSRDLTWLADPRVQRGGAMLEGRERIVDGRVDVALERVFRRLGQVTA
ncbi:MAG TPA: FliH/SctL family protein [Gemmatimonadaceae bacterium]|nr:FliH/SctL family protein [Gemmatimonadaceae bacterium]